MIVLGIDPGASTGLAWYIDGALTRLDTQKIAIEMIGLQCRVGVRAVVFEDSRLQTTFPRAVNPRAMIKIARNVGEIDAYCRLIEAQCARAGIKCIGVSPKGKGSKLNHEQFCRITGWTGKQTNQHERDAAMVAWPFRNGAKL